MQSHWKKTHRLRVSQANQGCGHPTSTPRLLWSPSLLNSSEPLSESSPTLVLPPCHLHFWCSLPRKAQRTGSEDICKGPERQASPSGLGREKAGESHVLAVLASSYWDTIGQFQVLLGISAAQFLLCAITFQVASFYHLIHLCNKCLFSAYCVLGSQLLVLEERSPASPVVRL